MGQRNGLAGIAHALLGKQVRDLVAHQLHAGQAFQCDEIGIAVEIAQRIAQYSAKVFSPNEREALMEYLRALEADAAPELRDTVLAMYGSRWLKPYDTILEYHREREKRDAVD